MEAESDTMYSAASSTLANGSGQGSSGPPSKIAALAVPVPGTSWSKCVDCVKK